jgi:hypothetical protein
VQQVYGIPQRVVNSGICWFAALMFAMFHNEAVARHVSGYLPQELRQDASRSLVDPAASERFREGVWRMYGMGDPYGQDPELDGQNGMTQLFVLAGKLGMPIARYFVDRDGMAHMLTEATRSNTGDAVSVPAAAESEAHGHLAVFRFRRGAHGSDERMRPPRRKVLCGRRYRLVAMMIGSEHCGHQISACASGPSWRQWAVCDSDAQHHGIGVTHWSVDTPNPSRTEWWDTWRCMVPTVKFHGGYCNLSPQNPSVASASSPTGGARFAEAGSGLTNVDFLYYSCPVGAARPISCS